MSILRFGKRKISQVAARGPKNRNRADTKGTLGSFNSGFRIFFWFGVWILGFGVWGLRFGVWSVDGGPHLCDEERGIAPNDTPPSSSVDVAVSWGDESPESRRERRWFDSVRFRDDTGLRSRPHCRNVRGEASDGATWCGG